MFIPEIMTSKGLLICIISINCKDSLHSNLLTMGHGQRNMYHRKNCLINLIFMLPIQEIVYFAHAQ